MSVQLPAQKEKALKRIRFKAFLMVMKVLAAGLEVEGGRGILEKKGDCGTGFSGQRDGQRLIFDFI